MIESKLVPHNPTALPSCYMILMNGAGVVFQGRKPSPVWRLHFLCILVRSFQRQNTRVKADGIRDRIQLVEIVT